MTAKARMRTTELARMAKIAKKFGVVIEQVIDGVTFRVLPHDTVAENPPEKATTAEADYGFDRPPFPIYPLFDQRELRVMELLTSKGVGVFIHSCTIGSFGPHTQAKLVSRGYAEVKHQAGNKFKDDQISLTKQGLKDWNAMKDYQSKYICLW